MLGVERTSYLRAIVAGREEEVKMGQVSTMCEGLFVENPKHASRAT